MNYPTFLRVCANGNSFWSSRIPNPRAWDKRPIKTLRIAMVKVNYKDVSKTLLIIVLEWTCLNVDSHSAETGIYAKIF